MELSIELRLEQHTRTVVKILDSVTAVKLNEFIAEQAVDGWVVESWLAKETLPFDDGVCDARAGMPENENPYAEHYWKHKEWSMGWNFFHENE